MAIDIHGSQNKQIAVRPSMCEWTGDIDTGKDDGVLPQRGHTHQATDFCHAEPP